MFCYISQDGSYQELAIEVVNGIGVAELEHLSMYAIVSTKAKTDNSQHVIHIVSPVPQKPATCESFGYKAHFECGCGKIFNDINASKELAQDDIILPAGHIDADSDGTCDICDKGELKQEDIRPSQSATKEPSDTSQATEQATQPSTQGTKQPDALPTRTQTAPSDSSPWLIPVAVAAVIVIAVVIAVTVIRKRK